MKFPQFREYESERKKRTNEAAIGGKGVTSEGGKKRTRGRKTHHHGNRRVNRYLRRGINANVTRREIRTSCTCLQGIEGKNVGTGRPTVCTTYVPCDENSWRGRSKEERRGKHRDHEGARGKKHPEGSRHGLGRPGGRINAKSTFEEREGVAHRAAAETAKSQPSQSKGNGR